MKITRVENATAAGTTDITTDIIDMQGFNDVTFIACLGDVLVTCALELVVQQDSAANMASAADVLGSTTSFTAGASDADNLVMAVGTYKPVERYVRAKLVRATANAVLDSIICIQGGAQTLPVTHDATTVLGTAHAASPAEG